MKQCISTDKAPEAIGPYSQGVKVGKLLFVSGQIPLTPETGRMVEGRIGEQTHQVLDNLKAVVEAAGGSLASVVKTTIYMTNISDFGIMNEIYGSYFTEGPPARATVQVDALPRGALIEIEAVAEIE